MLQRAFIEKSNVFQVGYKKYEIPHNFVNLNKLADNEYTFKENNWSCPELQGADEFWLDMVEELSMKVDK